MNRIVALLAFVLVAIASCQAQGKGWGPANNTQASGYISVNDPEGNQGDIFYWMFEAEKNAETAPIVLWLTGGPGCSSELAVFYEMGPYRISTEGKVSMNKWAWTKEVNMIFVDQPIGTGFSFATNGDYVTDEKEVAADMWAFLSQWAKLYPSLAKNDMYVFGESYAGHYVPAISWKIVQQNKITPTLNFKGLAIGNGLVWPSQQYLEYAPFAYENGLIGESTFQQLNQTAQQCYDELQQGSPFASSTCQQIPSAIIGNPPRFNIYDIKLPCNGPLCYDFSPVEKLLKEPSVLASLGVNAQNSDWQMCNGPVHSALMGDWFSNLEQNIPAMLEEGVKVLVYSGELDFICNWFGGRRWAEEMQWTGQPEYNGKDFHNWVTEDGSVSGTTKTSGNFTFLGVAEAGHMVPMDQPQNAFEMMMTFIQNGKF